MPKANVSNLVIVQEKEEHLLKITINMAINFPTSTLGRQHKCIGILLFPWFYFEKVYEWLRWLFFLYLNCISKFLARYKSLLRKYHEGTIAIFVFNSNFELPRSDPWKTTWILEPTTNDFGIYKILRTTRLTNCNG